MAYKEYDIAHEAGRFFVIKDRAHPPSFSVYRSGITHAEADSHYAPDEDGKSIANARCEYLHRREQERRR